MNDSRPADTAIAQSTTCCKRRWARHLAAAGLALWGIFTAVGFAAMLTYTNTSGPVTATPVAWPEGTWLQRDSTRANLVVVLHPRCPCSRATLTELEVILRHCRERVTTHVLFLKPDGFSDESVQSALWHTAVELPDVLVRADEKGQTARRFGATTSGHVALFAADGRRLFHGGITLGRGHQGDNLGRRAVIDLLTGATAQETEHVVFGCPLFSDQPVECAVSR